MVFARRFIRIFAAPKQGEIALTLTVISLVTMLFGTVIGLNRQSPQDVRSSAAGSVQCGSFGCTKNSDCAQSPIKTLCHLSSGQCRPMISTDSCPGGTPRVDSVKKDVGSFCNSGTECKSGLSCTNSRCTVVQTTSSSTGTKLGGQICDPMKNECIAGFYCGRPAGVGTPYTCQPGLESGGTGGGAIPTGIQYQGSTDPNRPFLGNSFVRNLATKCKIGWSYDKDPQIETLYLQSGGNKVITLTDRNLPKQRGSYSGNVDEAVVSFKNGGIYISFDPLDDINADGKPEIYLKVNLGGGTVREWYFDKPSPDWLGAEDTLVYLKYSGQIASEERWWYQQESVSSCFRGTITPTTTIPPALVACGEECTTTAQCADPERKGITCRSLSTSVHLTPGVGDKKYCLLPYPNNSRTCIPNTPTPSTGTPPPPTATSTPTKTPTPTVPTPSVTQPARCYKSVYFMIDTSSTQQSNIKPLIEKPLNDFFKTKTFKNVSFSYNTFNIVAPRQSGGPSNETIQFNLADNQNWTNLNAAFDVIKSRKEDIRVLISDGIPSVLGPFTSVRAKNSSIQLQCAYDTDGTNAKGCSPIADTPGRTDNYMKANDCKKDDMFGANFNKYCEIPYPVGSSTATHAVRLGGAEGISRTNLGKAGVPPEEIYDDMSTFLNKLEGIIQKAPCHPEPLALRPVTSSFSIQNTSINKTISSVEVKTCSLDGKQCQTFINPVRIEPQSTKQFSQPIPQSVLPENRTVFTCSVKLSDGSSLPCPEKKVIDESVRFALQSNGRQVSGSAQTFLQASDVNKDGVVNVIDYVLCQRQIAKSGAKSCDIIPDNVVNAQDFSVVTERFGQSSR